MRARAELLALVIVIFGFVLRVWDASGTFLNPDEALHVLIANQRSLDAVYRASLTQAHPPLLFFMMRWLRPFGNSELILRIPTILAGTLFCWIFFKWLKEILGREVALVGVMLAALLPPLISVTAQVRQYGLLLLFTISGAWLLERAVAEDSAILMLLSAACVWLAMLSHYSAFLFVATLGAYTLMRLARRETTTRTVIAWIAGQVVAASLAILLYLTHISKIKGTTMAEQAFDGWLRKSYFHHGHDSLLTFLVTRSFSLFQYIFGQLVVGDIVALLFLAGLVILVRSKVQISKARQFMLAFLLAFPFLLNYSLAVFDLYPYGGTRHCLYLSIFAIAGVSLCTATLAGEKMLRSAAIAAVIIVLCFAFRTNHAPYISRADQQRAHMDQAVSFIREQIAASEPILVDYESGLELAHYLCEQTPIFSEAPSDGFLLLDCGGHRIISTVPDVWAFTPEAFLAQWRDLLRSEHFKPGQKIWIAQMGWMVILNQDLSKQFPEFRNLETHAFGNNLRFFELSVGQTMPTPEASSRTAAAEHP